MSVVACCTVCRGAFCQLSGGRMASIHQAVDGKPCPVYLAENPRYVPLAYRNAFTAPTTATSDGGFPTWLARHKPGKGYERLWRKRLLVWRQREGLDPTPSE